MKRMLVIFVLAAILLVGTITYAHMPTSIENQNS
jgi:hypothetical protein